MSKIIGIDLEYDKQLCGCYGRRKTNCYCQRGRRKDNTIRCGIHKDRREADWRACKASGSYQRG